MIRFLTALAAISVLSAPAFAAPAIGQPAPAFTGADADGKTVSLADYAGKTVVLEWSNDQCPYVKKHYGAGNMQKLQQDLTAVGAVWLSVISSAPGFEGYLAAPQARAHRNLFFQMNVRSSGLAQQLLKPESGLYDEIGRIHREAVPEGNGELDSLRGSQIREVEERMRHA